MMSDVTRLQVLSGIARSMPDHRTAQCRPSVPQWVSVPVAGALGVPRVSTSFRICVSRVGSPSSESPFDSHAAAPSTGGHVSNAKNFGCRQLDHKSGDGRQRGVDSEDRRDWPPTAESRRRGRTADSYLGQSLSICRSARLVEKSISSSSRPMADVACAIRAAFSL